VPSFPRLTQCVDLVIFDWAGTMVDFGCRAPVIALLEAFGRHGVTLTEEEARRDSTTCALQRPGGFRTVGIRLLRTGTLSWLTSVR
jgi:beta-phosphoglucomutase-like phosphatase (HAD superfamily)